MFTAKEMEKSTQKSDATTPFFSLHSLSTRIYLRSWRRLGKMYLCTHLTLEERVNIFSYLYAGIRLAETVRKQQCSKTVVQNFTRLGEKYGTAPRPGIPAKMTSWYFFLLLWDAKNQKKSAKDLRKSFNWSIKYTRVCQFLNGTGLFLSPHANRPQDAKGTHGKKSLICGKICNLE